MVDSLSNPNIFENMCTVYGTSVTSNREMYTRRGTVKNLKLYAIDN